MPLVKLGPGPFQKKVKRTKQRYDRKAKFVLLEPNDVVLVRKISHTGKHKIQNRWESLDVIKSKLVTHQMMHAT